MKRWSQFSSELKSADKKVRREARADLVGILCGVFLVVVALVSIILAQIPARAGVKDSEVPEGALTLLGTAPGRNGDIAVTVVTDGEKIYQI